MEFLSYLIVVFLVLFIYHAYSIQFKRRKLPPGPFTAPFGLGVIGSAIYEDPARVLQLSNLRPWEILHAWEKKYGDFYSVEAGNFYSVVVTSYELMHEMANMDEYSIKFANETLTYPRTFNKELGLIFVAKPELWVEMRKFTQRTLRDFGFGKRHTMQSAIEAETTALIKEFKDVTEKHGGIIRIRTTFVLSVLNVLWCMVAGQRYEHDDPKLVKMMDRNFAMTKSTTFAEPFNLAFSYLKKIMPSLFKDDLRLRVYDECHKFTQSLVEERKAEGHYKSNPQNYIDVFLQKIEEGKNGKESSVYTGNKRIKQEYLVSTNGITHYRIKKFHEKILIYTRKEEQLQAMLADLLQTGSTTTNGTLNYGLLYLLLNPEIQKKCQAEIDATVPRHLTPTLEDIEKMPYFQAFIHETHRLANIVPNPIPRTVPRDWNIRGYTIPKGTTILSNHYSIHMSEKYWGDPHVFRPERFINEKGEFFPDKRVVHFGFGKRICIGITLANSVIPIFLATLLQHFNFSVVPGTQPPSTEPEVGVSLSPLEYPVYVTNRVAHEPTAQG